MRRYHKKNNTLKFLIMIINKTIMDRKEKLEEIMKSLNDYYGIFMYKNSTTQSYYVIDKKLEYPLVINEPGVFEENEGLDKNDTIMVEEIVGNLSYVTHYVKLENLEEWIIRKSLIK